MTITLKLPPPVKPTLLDRVRAEPPHWADERIRLWPTEEYRVCLPFTRYRYWCDTASINVFLVIGTQQPRYAGLTWLQFLEEGPRIPDNLQAYQKNPGYYLDTATKQPPMIFETWNGYEYYVAGDGQYRICIARFTAFYEGRCLLHGVTVSERHIDRELLALWQQLKEIIGERRILMSVEPVSRTLSRQDTAGWQLESYEVQLRVIFEGRFWPLNAAGALSLLRTLQAPRWRRWFWIRRQLQQQVG